MPVNPATKPEHLNSPIERANDLNSPEFQNQEGYYPYDLTHAEYLTPLFGKITPSMHLITAPADRHVVCNDIKTILNRINGNFLSTVNQYLDSFYVPFRSVFPTNFEKLLPNPTKGDDLPNSALPQFPLGMFVFQYCFGDLTISDSSGSTVSTRLDNSYAFDSDFHRAVCLGRLIYIATMLSRGQLLDYLGVGLDLDKTDSLGNSIFQESIDTFFQDLWVLFDVNLSADREISYLNSARMSPYSNILETDTADLYYPTTISEFRQSLDDILEKGRFPLLYFNVGSETALTLSYNKLVQNLRSIFYRAGMFPANDYEEYLTEVDSSSNPFDVGYINIGLVLAYQQVVAQYFTNDSVDNIFNSDLYMQNLRSVMFPTSASNRFTSEPIFQYNGVATEYDYISAAASYSSLVDTADTALPCRQMIYISLMFLLRRSLRYGDYFSSSRPRMLAVGDLMISAEGGVSPIDVTQNLLKQRYLNAVNYTGSGFLKYYASQFGVTPSDTTTYPRFLAHKKIVLQNQLTNNTADQQGKQTTNLVGYSGGVGNDGKPLSNFGFDVFIDDIGFLVQVISYDVLPVYTSGIDNSYHLADRFDFFNPMLQNIGDQPIRLSELVGNPSYRQKTFGYTMRNSEYKYKLSKAHGAFVNNDLHGYLMKYPFKDFEVPVDGESGDLDIKISPEFIRDKACYLDSSIPALTGASPAKYFHFIVACVNEVKSARKIQQTPPILF